MKHRFGSLLIAALGIVVLPVLSACETAPATGRTIFTGGMSAKDEVQLGYKEHQKIVPQFGGAYEDPALNAYVSSIGQLLAKTSETPDLKFTFTILDSPIVNAFALPGGYVYVTRGLLALADNEAEVAGVLAHEIGHVTARHSAERYGQNVAASVLGVGLGLLLGKGPATDLAGAATAVALRSYSREQEHEADTLGVRYLSRVGYDPQAMATFLGRMLENSRLDSELRGKPGKADEFSIMQTHPRTVDRVQRSIQVANAKTVNQPITARKIYFRKIDGMLYGDSPKQGFVHGRKFLHPDLRFAFEVPQGFRLFNSPKRVIARGPNKAAILFDRAGKPYQGPMRDYLTRVWGKGANLKKVERLDINGMEAATGHTRMNSKSGPADVRMVVIRYDAENIYQMIFVTPTEMLSSLSTDLRATTYSFRRLSAAEAAALKPLRLSIYRVRPGDSAAKLADRMPFEDYRLRRFQVINGLKTGQKLKPGTKVKVITK